MNVILARILLTLLIELLKYIRSMTPEQKAALKEQIDNIKETEREPRPTDP